MEEKSSVANGAGTTALEGHAFTGKAVLLYCVENALVGTVYFFLGALGFFFGNDHILQLVFPPAGIAVAAPLIFGFRVWPGIFLGAWFLGLAAGNETLIVTVVAVGNTLEGLGAAWLVNRYAGGVRFFQTPRHIVKFVLLAGVLSPLLSPPFGIASSSLRSLAFWAHNPSSVAVWWLGEMTSVLVLTPLLVQFAVRGRACWNRARCAEFALLLLLLATVSVVVFADLPPSWAQGYLLPYLCLPFPLWAALRFGLRATAITIWVQALVALWGTLHGYGLFAWSMPDKALMAYQGFTSFNSVMGLLVAAVVQQREDARGALQVANDELDARVQHCTLDLRDEIEVRKQAEAKLAKAHGELELRVADRTTELVEVNRRLEVENRRRSSTEAALSRVLHRLIDSQETERCRISRELHDEMGQNLNALKLGLKVLGNGDQGLRPPLASLVQLEDLADRLIQNVHRMAWELRPPALDDFGLAPALERYSEEWSKRTGIPVDFREVMGQSSRLPARIETTLYRVTQEALTNVAKHAKATRVSVLLQSQPECVSLIVEDNGQGFDGGEPLERPNSSGKLGLVGMQERVSAVGGKLQIESAVNAGTTLFIRIPLSCPLPDSTSI